MKSAVLALVALVLGIVAGSWIVRYPAVHRVAGRIFQRGELLALVGQRGIFEADVQARAQQKQYCSGMTDETSRFGGENRAARRGNCGGGIAHGCREIG